MDDSTRTVHAISRSQLEEIFKRSTGGSGGPGRVPNEIELHEFARSNGYRVEEEVDTNSAGGGLAEQAKSGSSERSQSEIGTVEPRAPLVMWDVVGRLPLAPSSTAFVEWINRQGIDRKASGAIGPRALLSFLASWCQAEPQRLTPFFKSEFPESPEKLTTLAIGLLERNQLPSGKTGFAYISHEGAEVLLEAQVIAKKLRRETIEPHHVLAALLVRAAKDNNPDAFLGSKPGRMLELRKAFLIHVKDAGYGEAWDYWEQAFSLAQPSKQGEEEEGSRTSKGQIAGAVKIVSPTSAGTRFAPKREATDDELCLDIGAFSQAIADTFTAAAEEDDFVFALYAPWGRGKSTLIKQVAKILGGDPANGELGRGYQPIFFSAWKYPTRPEVWVHLYQKIAATAQEGGVLQQYRVGFRMGLLQRGWLPLVGGLFLLAVSRLYFEATHWLLDGLGVMGLIIIGSFLWNAGQFGKHVATTYLSTPDHGEKLGLQAVIGRDLKDLLNIWIHPKNRREDQSSARLQTCDFSSWGVGLWCLLLVIGLAWLTVGLVSWKLYRHLEVAENARAAAHDTGTNAPPSKVEVGGREITNDRAGEVSGADWVKLTVLDGILGLLGLAFSLFVLALARKPRQHERIFLVVDDLDRCEPSQMLAVIESLRLFLDEPEMSRRLQVAMLLDRGILKRAIINKGKRYQMLPAAGSAAVSKFFREQEEKFFVASLQLPPLGQTEMADLALKVVDREYREQLIRQIREMEAEAKQPVPTQSKVVQQPSAPTSRGPIGPPGRSTMETVVMQVPANAEAQAKWKEHTDALGVKIQQALEQLKQAGSEPSKTPKLSPAADAKKPEDFTFHYDERELLKKALAKLARSHPTPRSVRAFVLRYQLVRLVLRQLEEEFAPSEVIDGLAARVFPDSNVTPKQLAPSILAAIEMVAGRDDDEPEP